jgi:hypothetical protein
MTASAPAGGNRFADAHHVEGHGPAPERGPGGEPHLFCSGSTNRRAGQGPSATRSYRGVLRGQAVGGVLLRAQLWARIDYRQMILVTSEKPWRLRRYRWREELLPTLIYRAPTATPAVITHAHAITGHHWMVKLRPLTLAIRKTDVEIGPPSCAHQAFHLGLREALSAIELRRASQAIIAESEHRAARDAPFPLSLDSVQSTDLQ